MPSSNLLPVDFFFRFYERAHYFCCKAFPLDIISKAYNQFFSDSKELTKYVKSITGVTPAKIKLYKQVFRHKSSFSDPKENNERLELLGDSVLDLIVAEYLFKKYPYREEGFITELKSKIVNRKSFNTIGQKLGLIEKLSWNKKTSSDVPKDIAGNTFEALVGALYLDAGFKTTRRFVYKRVLQGMLDVDELESTETDFKSKVFHYAQRHGKQIEFRTVSEQSKNKRSYFTVELIIGDKKMGEGEGFSKKMAEQAAAMKALNKLKAAE